jgi:hypothetical protein
MFKFPGTLSIKNKGDDKFQKSLSVCLDNSKNLKFQVLKSVRDILMTKLCQEPTDCSTKDDLNDFNGSDQVLELHMIGKVIRNEALKDGRLFYIIIFR